MARLEFTRKVRAQIVLRATNAAGVITCEGCGLVLGKKPYEVDHTLAEALRDHTDRKPLTADDGRLLGKACCHAPKTADDIRRIRKAQRQGDKDTGAMKPKKPWHPHLRKKMDGTVVPRFGSKHAVWLSYSSAESDHD